MEAAGVDPNAKCLVIRGVSDYADSHKNDVWKHYAARNAAAFARELLCQIQPSEVKQIEGPVEKSAAWFVPFARNGDFVDREDDLEEIGKKLSSSEKCQRVAIWALRVSGKTAVALEYAHQAYREIGAILGIPGARDGSGDVQNLVKTRLSDEACGEWLKIIDNADAIDVLFEPKSYTKTDRLIDCLPNSCEGSILFTTRTLKSADYQVSTTTATNVIEITRLSRAQAKEMLEKRLRNNRLLEDNETVERFLETLAYLPLAIVQAVAFINENGSTISEYLSTYKEAAEEAFRLLDEEFEAQGRYPEMRNPVAATWYISFDRI
ncbi:MAG: hypothetical protein M1820_006784 [Bogoriella megaspora]|nr:MAG: hypothetical protein M1820_006784 [Bogoriella megaspora]